MQLIKSLRFSIIAGILCLNYYFSTVRVKKMSSDSSDEDIILYNYYRKRRNRQKKRRYWIHPYIEKNIKCRAFVAAKELQETDAKFLAFYRMSKESYIHLVQLLVPAIHKKNTPMRECVGADERILITLR